MIPLGDSTKLRKPSVITPLLIWSNCILYVFMLFKGPSLEYYSSKWGLIPYKLQQSISVLPSLSPVFWTIITCLFLHGGLWHLISNMLFLWIFGDNVEDRMGKASFLVFYLLGGIAASLTQFCQNPSSRIPMIGASGAISAVMGAYILLYPGAFIETMIPIFFFPLLLNVPALLFIVFWFGNQLINAALGTPGVGWWAHMGGFLFGLVWAIFLKVRNRKPPVREIIYPR